MDFSPYSGGLSPSERGRFDRRAEELIGHIRNVGDSVDRLRGRGGVERKHAIDDVVKDANELRDNLLALRSNLRQGYSPGDMEMRQKYNVLCVEFDRVAEHINATDGGVDMVLPLGRTGMVGTLEHYTSKADAASVQVSSLDDIINAYMQGEREDQEAANEENAASDARARPDPVAGISARGKKERATRGRAAAGKRHGGRSRTATPPPPDPSPRVHTALAFRDPDRVRSIRIFEALRVVANFMAGQLGTSLDNYMVRGYDKERSPVIGGFEDAYNLSLAFSPRVCTLVAEYHHKGYVLKTIVDPDPSKAANARIVTARVFAAAVTADEVVKDPKASVMDKARATLRRDTLAKSMV